MTLTSSRPLTAVPAIAALLLGFALPTQAAADAPNGGEFTAQCPRSHVLADDPIVYPRQPGMAHLHDFFANTSTDAYSTHESLRTASSTCTERPRDTAAYWAPTLLYDGEPVRPNAGQFYYRGGGISDDATIRAFPRNLRIIAGDHRATAENPQDVDVVSWACSRDGDEIEVQVLPTTCNGSELRMRIVFPQCWDGVHRDSVDHKSHMMYSNGSVCPPSHPVPVPELTYSIRYNIDGVLAGHVLLSSGGTYSGHGDFLNSWPQQLLRKLVVDCINVGVDCDPDGVPIQPAD